METIRTLEEKRRNLILDSRNGRVWVEFQSDLNYNDRVYIPVSKSIVTIARIKGSTLCWFYIVRVMSGMDLKLFERTLEERSNWEGI